MYSTFRFLFDEESPLYYINQQNYGIETTKSSFIRQHQHSVFQTDIYISEHFFRLFAHYIQSADHLGDSVTTAYVKKTGHISQPFYIGFNPIFFLIHFFSDVNTSVCEKNDSKHLCDIIRQCCVSNLTLYTKHTDREHIAQQFIESYKQKKWTFYGWMYWNDLLIKYHDFCAFICRVFVHEMYHILFGHLDETVYNPQKFSHFELMNIAEDFVINNSILWDRQSNELSLLYSKPSTCLSPYFQRYAYHRFNNVFVLELMKYYLHYLLYYEYITEKKDVAKAYLDCIEKLLSDKDAVEHNFRKKENHIYEMVKHIEKYVYASFSYDLGLYEHKPNAVDFYYRILQFAKQQKLLNEQLLQINILLDSHSEHTQSSTESSSQLASSSTQLSENENQHISEVLNHILEKISEHIESEKGTSKHTPRKVLDDLIRNKNIEPIKVFLEKSVLYHLWKKKLRDFISLNGYSDVSTENRISFKKENRRIKDLYVYFERNISCYDFILVLDVSPSIGKEEYLDFVKEIKCLSRYLDIKRLRVIQFSSNIVCDDYVNIQQIENMKIKTQSSTDLQSVFEYLQKEHNKKPIVVFTDGYFPYFNPTTYGFKHLIYVTISSHHLMSVITPIEEMKKYNFNIISKYNL